MIEPDGLLSNRSNILQLNALILEQKAWKAFVSMSHKELPFKL